jgi:hypothetical protein
MSHSHQVGKAIRRAAARDKKREPNMKVSGTSVFSLQKLLRKQAGNR